MSVSMHRRNTYVCNVFDKCISCGIFGWIKIKVPHCFCTFFCAWASENFKMKRFICRVCAMSRQAKETFVKTSNPLSHVFYFNKAMFSYVIHFLWVKNSLFFMFRHDFGYICVKLYLDIDLIKHDSYSYRHNKRHHE